MHPDITIIFGPSDHAKKEKPQSEKPEQTEEALELTTDKAQFYKNKFGLDSISKKDEEV